MRFAGETILITGATGSLGGELVRLLLETGVRTVRVLSRGEHRMADLMDRFGHDDRLRPLIGDVRDADRMREAMVGVDCVIAAAALKRIETAEYNASEAIWTNVVGTQVCVDAAVDAGVRRFLFVSTDKAVAPVTLYGATKMLAEGIVLGKQVGMRPTRMSVVRYGNVTGSNGSVVPLFKRMRSTGRLHITSPQCTRFAISLPDAARFVLRSLSDMIGGEVMVPKMPSLRITDLAKAVAPECEHIMVGLRGKEKIHEELMLPGDFYDEENDRYVIHAGGKRSGFRYASDTNGEWLSVEQLREMVTGGMS